MPIYTKNTKITDGDDVTKGTKADAVAASDTATASEIALIKKGNTNTSAIKTSVDAVKTSTDLVKTATDSTTTAVTGMSGKLPASLGQKTLANSLSVGIASDQGALPITDTARNTLVGAVTETAPASDTASSGLNGRLQRIAQRLTSLISLLPSSLGGKTAANSLSVTFATDTTGFPVTLGGLDNDNAVQTNVKVLPTGGVAEDFTAPLTGYTALDAAMLTFDKTTRALKCTIGDIIALYDSITISDTIVTSAFEITRPANTTAYAANDVIGLTSPGVLVFNGVSKGYGNSDGRSPAKFYDGSGYITKLIAKAEDSNMVGKNMRLWMFDGSIDVQTDNTPANFINTYQKMEIGYIDFVFTAALATGGYPATAMVDKIVLPYKTLATYITAVLMTKDAVTANSASSKIWIQLTCTKNIG
ncbi:MAG: hypothetical protein ABI241_00470 [Bacteroidia bacterium]